MTAPSADIDAVPPDIDVGILGVPLDDAVSRQPGARYGPNAIRDASRWYGHVAGGPTHHASSGRTVDWRDLEIRDFGDVPVQPRDLKTTGDYVEAAVTELTERTFPLLIGGDHYLTYPSFRGVQSAIDGPIGRIHVDAHSDTIDETPLHGKHFHGSTMARIDELPAGDPSAHAMVGLRAFEGPDFETATESRGALALPMSEVRSEGLESCVERCVQWACDGTSAVYATVDIDSVDPAFAPGTGTPVPGGLTSEQFLSTMELLGRTDAICALDLVEVAPRLDPTGVTQCLAAAGIVRFLESKFLA